MGVMEENDPKWFDDKVLDIKGSPGSDMPQAASLFVLWHSHELGAGETDDKLLGVYSNKAQAEAAKGRRLQNRGFRETPEGFHISEYKLDQDEWSGGFSTSRG